MSVALVSVMVAAHTHAYALSGVTHYMHSGLNTDVIHAQRNLLSHPADL